MSYTKNIIINKHNETLEDTLRNYKKVTNKFLKVFKKVVDKNIKIYN